MSESRTGVALITGAARGQGRAHALTLATPATTSWLRRAGGLTTPAVPHIDAGRPAGDMPAHRETRPPGRSGSGRRPLDGRSGASGSDRQSRARRLGRRRSPTPASAVSRRSRTSPMSSGTRCRPSIWAACFAPFGQRCRPCARRGSGRILATASMAGRGGAPHLAHYAAAKAGVISLVKTLALELGSSGVTANGCARRRSTPRWSTTRLCTGFSLRT